MAIHDIERREPGIQNPDLEEDGFPYHITFTPPAMGRLIVKDVIDELRVITESTRPFALTVEGKANFGSESEPFWVTKYDSSPAAVRLHRRLMNSMVLLDPTIDLTWTELGSMGWTAHSSDMSSWPQQTQPVMVTDITVVQRDGDNLILLDRLGLNGDS